MIAHYIYANIKLMSIASTPSFIFSNFALNFIHIAKTKEIKIKIKIKNIHFGRIVKHLVGIVHIDVFAGRGAVKNVVGVAVKEAGGGMATVALCLFAASQHVASILPHDAGGDGTRA